MAERQHTPDPGRVPLGPSMTRLRVSGPVAPRIPQPVQPKTKAPMGIVRTLLTVLAGAAARAFTKKNGSLATVSGPTGYDLEAVVALLLRGLVLLALAWAAMKLGVPMPAPELLQ